MNRPFYVLIFIFLLFLRYLELLRSTGSLSLTMIMFLFSPLLMITYGSGITRLVPVLVELCELLNSDVRIFFGGGGGGWKLLLSAIVSLGAAILYDSSSSSQITVPHNESDKVARGGLDKMTLVEVCCICLSVKLVVASIAIIA